MNTHPNPHRSWTPAAGATYTAAIELAAGQLDRPTGRSLGSYARRYLALCETADLDPFDPDPASLRGALTDAGLLGSQRSKTLWAARATCAAAGGIAGGRPGPTAGRTVELVDELEPGLLRTAVEAVIAASDGRAGVVRSALGRLLDWARREGFDPTELSGPDVDVFAEWLTDVYGHEIGEYLVVARMLCRVLDGSTPRIGDLAAPTVPADRSLRPAVAAGGARREPRRWSQPWALAPRRA